MASRVLEPHRSGVAPCESRQPAPGSASRATITTIGANLVSVVSAESSRSPSADSQHAVVGRFVAAVAIDYRMAVANRTIDGGDIALRRCRAAARGPRRIRARRRAARTNGGTVGIGQAKVQLSAAIANSTSAVTAARLVRGADAVTRTRAMPAATATARIVIITKRAGTLSRSSKPGKNMSNSYGPR